MPHSTTKLSATALALACLGTAVYFLKPGGESPRESPGGARAAAPAPLPAPASAPASVATPVDTLPAAPGVLPRQPAELIGMKLSPGQPAATEAWCRTLSRNPEEYAQRRSDLRHLKRGEVVGFADFTARLDSIQPEQLPLEMAIPWFDGGTIKVKMNHMTVDGVRSGTLSGRLADRPEVSVVLGFQDGETSGIVEGPSEISYYDAVQSGAVILRELDESAHRADYQCDCDRHRAMRSGGQAAPAPQ